jgi:hypothetical protein
MIKLLPLFFLLSFGESIQNLSSGQITNESISSWKTINDKNFSIQYPSDWELNQSGQMSTTFILFAPLDSDKDAFKENVNLLMQDLQGYKMDLDQYTKISEEQIKKMITNSVIVESKRIKTNTDEYQQIIFTGDQGVFHLKFMQQYRVINEKAFVLTLTCEQEKFESYRAAGENIFKSFTINK